MRRCPVRADRRRSHKKPQWKTQIQAQGKHHRWLDAVLAIHFHWTQFLCACGGWEIVNKHNLHMSTRCRVQVPEWEEHTWFMQQTQYTACNLRKHVVRFLLQQRRQFDFITSRYAHAKVKHGNRWHHPSARLRHPFLSLFLSDLRGRNSKNSDVIDIYCAQRNLIRYHTRSPTLWNQRVRISAPPRLLCYTPCKWDYRRGLHAVCKNPYLRNEDNSIAIVCVVIVHGPRFECTSEPTDYVIISSLHRESAAHKCYIIDGAAAAAAVAAAVATTIKINCLAKSYRSHWKISQFLFAFIVVFLLLLLVFRASKCPQVIWLWIDFKIFMHYPKHQLENEIFVRLIW